MYMWWQRAVQFVGTLHLQGWGGGKIGHALFEVPRHVSQVFLMRASCAVQGLPAV